MPSICQEPHSSKDLLAAFATLNWVAMAASRFTELRTLLEGELRRIEAQGAASNREFGARLEQSERGMQEKLADATGTLSAYLGEIEDKLDRALVPAHALGLAPPTER